MKNSKIKIMVECALLIAVGTILAQIKLYRMPSGGSITCLSMLPFLLISFRHGTKWGVLSGIANSILQIALGGLYAPPAGTAIAMFGSIMLDYVLAYTVLGFAKAFGKPLEKNHPLGAILLGSGICCFLRFLCAFLSGILIWGSLTEDAVGAIVYSLGYNGIYMIPETALVLIAFAVLYKKAPILFKAEN